MVRFEGNIQLFLIVFLLHCSLIILNHFRLTWHFKCVWVHHATVAFLLDHFLIGFFFSAFYFRDFVENVPFEYHVIDVCQRSREVHETLRILGWVPFFENLLWFLGLLLLSLQLVRTNQWSIVHFRSYWFFFLLDRSSRIFNQYGAIVTAMTISSTNLVHLSIRIINTHFLAESRNGDVSVFALVIYRFGLVTSRIVLDLV